MLLFLRFPLLQLGVDDFMQRLEVRRAMGWHLGSASQPAAAWTVWLGACLKQ